MAIKAQSKKKKVYCGICSDWEIKRPEKCSNTTIHKGTKVYFCTSKCKERFLKTPDNFL